MNILFEPDAVKSVRSPALRGSYTADDAIRWVLKGSKLEAQHTTATNVVVKAKSAARTALPAASGGPAPNPGTRVAQSSPGGLEAVDAAQPDSDQKSKSKSGLEEIVVTGTRLRLKATEGAQDVKTYSREQIDESGQTSIADFLNTLSDVSVASTESNLTTFGGATTVQLHGLPAGSTLMLLNGRRLETSGSQGFSNFFDLNSIPLAAVDRIEVVSEGSSAVYGSDALAGVVNIVLKQDLDGLEVDGGFGRAAPSNEENASLAWGKSWTGGSLSLIGSYQTRSELIGDDRSITANQNYTSLGGSDVRIPSCNPGNVFSIDGSNLPGLNSSFAAVPVGLTGTTNATDFRATAGKLNLCSIVGLQSFIPETHRTGFFATGKVALSSSIEAFSEVMYSRTEEFAHGAPPTLYSSSSCIENTVSANNPYNPFHETVGIAGSFNSLGPLGVYLDTQFVRSLLGVRGTMFGSWDWEVAAWEAHDHSTDDQTNNLNPVSLQNALNSSNPAQALNPFVDGPYGSPQLLG
jgi:iron complex outermembrane receptor protein